MKITKLDKRFTLYKQHGFRIKVDFETFSEWEIIYHWGHSTYGDFIVLPPMSMPPGYIDERGWGITLGEQYELFFKDETAQTMLLLLVDSKH